MIKTCAKDSIRREFRVADMRLLLYPQSMKFPRVL